MRSASVASALLTLALLAGVSLPSRAGVLIPQDWYVFGDSISDQGNLFAATAGAIPPDPPYYEGRFSNGPVWAELLPESIDVVNFSVGGAGTGRENVWGPYGGVLDQVDAFAGAGPADPDALYVIFAGSNNFLSLLDPEDIPAAVAAAITDIATAALTLEAVGAERFLFVGLPDLGLTPRLVSDPFLSAGGTALTDGFNGQLPLALTGAGLTDFEIFDSAALLRAFVADPAGFGLSVVDEACMTLEPFSMCADPSGYAFWDDIHPTTAAHEIFANEILALVPEPAALLLLGGSLGTLALRRRTRQS